MYTYTIFNNHTSPMDIFDDFFFGTSRAESAMDYPTINIYEANDRIEIRALMPGVSASDLDMELHNDILVLKGQKKNDRGEDQYLRTERKFGSFTRTIRLPYRVNPETVSARFENGVLQVSLEKNEDAKAKKIAIQ